MVRGCVGAGRELESVGGCPCETETEGEGVWAGRGPGSVDGVCTILVVHVGMCDCDYGSVRVCVSVRLNGLYICKSPWEDDMYM